LTTDRHPTGESGAATGPPGVQGRARILENDLNLFLRGRRPLPTSLEQALSLESDVALSRLVHPDDGIGHGALPGARFANQAEGLPFPHRKGDAVHRLDGDRLSFQDAGVSYDEVFLQVGDGQKISNHTL
jgi:hypothetical protein